MKDECNEPEMIEDEKSFTSAKLLLDLAYKEYMYESERKKNLETKSGICIALSGTMLTILLVRLGGIEFPAWNDEYQFWKFLVEFVKVALYIGTFVMLLKAIINFIDVLLLAVYKRLNIGECMDYTSNSEEEFSQFVVGYLNDYICYNNEKNLEKSIKFSKGLYCIRKAIYLMLLFVIFKVICRFFSI